MSASTAEHRPLVPAATDASHRPSPGWRTWQYFLLLGIAIAVVYYPGIGAPFIFDDQAQLGNHHPERHSLWPLSKFIHMLRPAGYFTFAANIQLTGLTPAGLRVVNIVMHLGSACLLFWLCRRGLKRRGNWQPLVQHANGLALAMALLWGIHPLPTGAVTYIVQRFESQMSFCLLLALVALWQGARTKRSHRAWPWYVLAVLAAWFGAATKEIMVVAPVLYLLVDRAFLARSWRELCTRRWGVHLALAGCWPVIWVTHRLGAAMGDYASAGFGGKISTWEYLRTQPGVILHYLSLIVWPRWLILDYHWPIATSPLQIYGLGSIVVVLLAASVWLWFTRPRVGVVALSFFLLLALTSSVLPIADPAMEYRMYLPSAAVIILAVLGGFALLQRVEAPVTRSKMGFRLVVVAATLLGGRTYLRNQEYREPLRIWLQCAHYNRANGRACSNVAGRLGAMNQLEAAIPFYERALASDFPDKGMVHINFARDLLRAKRTAEAIEHYQAALAILPADIVAGAELAEAYHQAGQEDEALQQAERVLKLQPQNAKALKLKAELSAKLPASTTSPPQ